MDSFVRTNTILDDILAHKAEETALCKQRKPEAALIAEMQSTPAPLDFVGALHRSTVALIAEVKRASPSKGVLIDPFDPGAIATTYAENGAAAISVLTDEKFFQGNIRYLKQIRRLVECPLLCKEFVIDPYQIYEAREAGADAVLLIVAALEDARLADLHTLIHALGMAALVEVHDEGELERALKVGAVLIGVNNRDLKTFAVDLNTTFRLAQQMPPHVTLVAESGISGPDDVHSMGMLGAHAVLVGESLVKAADMALTVRAFSSQPRQIRSPIQNQTDRIE